MKIVVAQMEHETNTFSPLPTPWESFGAHGPLLGAEALAGMRGTGTAMGGFLAVAEAAGAEIVTPIAAYASPSGPVDGDAYDRICDLICAAVAEGCDAVFLDLHGAMVVADRTDDGEGTLLERMRALAPDTMIAVALDLHANVTERIVANCDVLAGYKTYPHVDMARAGELAGSIALRALAGEVRPVMAWGNVPILAQTLKMNTAEGAMKAFVDEARAAELRGALAASPFGGFPMADIAEAGMSTVVVTDGDPTSAAAARDRILRAAWADKDDFVWRDEPLTDAVARAASLAAASSAHGPVLLIDHADNCASGGTQDTMHVLAEALRQGLTGIAVGPVRDPGAVDVLVRAGPGATVTLPVGGVFDLPAIGRLAEPLELTGVVRAMTDGEYTITGPQLTGVRAHMGRTVVLDTGPAQVVITERQQEPWDTGVFTSVGIDPTRQRFLLLKSRMYFRPVFLPFAAATVYCDGVGVTSSDWTRFRYTKVRRPIFPLDDTAAFA